MIITRVPFAEQSPKTRFQAVFVAVTCRHFQPYIGYACVENQQEVIPTVLMLFRWDSRLGFVGGKVDPGETLVAAAVREAHEEAALTLNVADLIPVCSHLAEDNGFRFNTHLYTYDVSRADIVKARDEALRADHALAEVSGILLPQLELLTPEGHGLPRFLKNQTAPSVLEELAILFHEHQLLPDVVKHNLNAGQRLERAFEMAGLDLYELLG